MAACSEIGERLLKKEEKWYFRNCPGCKVEQRKQSQSGFSFIDVTRIMMIALVSALPISSLFPFQYFMIRDFHIAEKEEYIGYYAGYVASAYMLGRGLTSIFWGMMSDRYGRKPIIIIGTVTVVIFNTLFGLSVNYWMAIIARFLLGSLNGLYGPLKVYSTEIFRDEYQALGMSMVTTAWGIGLVIGPALGGFLAQPAEKYPSIFSSNSIFGRFPYFLPCLCISIFAFSVTIICFWLPETMHKHNEKKMSDFDSFEAVESVTCLTGDNIAINTNKSDEPQKSLLRNWPLMSSIIVYSVISLHEIAFSEIFPLWAVSPLKFGGLSYSTERVGEVLVISGVSLLLFQMFLFPCVEKYFGTILVCRLSGVLITLPLLASFPSIGLLSGLTLFVVLTIASTLKVALGLAFLTGLLLLQNRAVPQEQRGAANGISMTLMSLFQAVGPAAAGTVFSWAETRQNALFLPGTQMVFFMLNVVMAIGVLMTSKLFLATVP